MKGRREEKEKRMDGNQPWIVWLVAHSVVPNSRMFFKKVLRKLALLFPPSPKVKLALLFIPPPKSKVGIIALVTVMWASEEEGDGDEDKEVDDFDHRGLGETGLHELNTEAKTGFEHLVLVLKSHHREHSNQI